MTMVSLLADAFVWGRNRRFLLALSSDGSSVIEELERTSAESRASQSLIDYYHEAHDNIEFLTSNLIRYFVLSLANCIHLTKQCMHANKNQDFF